MDEGKEGAEVKVEEVEIEVEVEGVRMITSLSSSPPVISIEFRGGVIAEREGVGEGEGEIIDGGVDILFLEREKEPASIEWTG